MDGKLKLFKDMKTKKNKSPNRKNKSKNYSGIIEKKKLLTKNSGVWRYKYMFNGKWWAGIEYIGSMDNDELVMNI